MRLLISRRSVFVWGPEDCLSKVFVFVERKTVFAVASIIDGLSTTIVQLSPSDDAAATRPLRHTSEQNVLVHALFLIQQ